MAHVIRELFLLSLIEANVGVSIPKENVLVESGVMFVFSDTVLSRENVKNVALAVIALRKSGAFGSGLQNLKQL